MAGLSFVTKKKKNRLKSYPNPTPLLHSNFVKIPKIKKKFKKNKIKNNFLKLFCCCFLLLFIFSVKQKKNN